MERKGYIGNTINFKTAHKSYKDKRKRRILELNGIFKKLYADRMSSRLTDERFEMLSQDYEDERLR